MNTVLIILLVVLAIAVVLLFAICGFLFNQVIWYKPIKLPAAKGEVEDDFAKDHRKAEEEFGKMPFEKLTLTASNGEKIYARLLLPEKSNGRMIIACHGAHSSGICEFCFSAPYFHRMGYTILMPEHRGCGLAAQLLGEAICPLRAGGAKHLRLLRPVTDKGTKRLLATYGITDGCSIVPTEE